MHNNNKIMQFLLKYFYKVLLIHFEYLNIFFFSYNAKFIKVFKFYGKLLFGILTLFEDRPCIQNSVFCKLFKCIPFSGANLNY